MIDHALVTGAGGFIASHLVEALLADGVRVRALVHYNCRGAWGWLDHLRAAPPSDLELMLGDVTDPFQMARAVAGCDTVFHLAALIGIPYSYEAPASYVSTNLTGSLNLLQAAATSGVRRFLQTSTSEVYGTACYSPIDEAHPLQAQSPYAATKIGADKLAESFSRSFGLPVLVVRPFNTYGPRQSTRAVIPTIIAQALTGQEIRLGALSPERDMTYVSDTVAGFLAAARADLVPGGEAINLGTGHCLSIGELAATICRLMQVDLPIVATDERQRPARSEVYKLLSDNRRARDLLGWSPAVTLEEGLQRTIDWYRTHPDTIQASGYSR